MRLHGHEAVPALLVSKIECLGKLLSRHATGAPKAHLAATHEGIQRFKGFFKRSSKIPTVNLVQVDVVHLEPAQRILARLNNLLTTQPATVMARPHLAPGFGGHNDVIA